MTSRLAKLSVADHGFFVLAVHAKLEAYFQQTLEVEPQWGAKFSDLVHAWFRQRIDQVGFEPRTNLRERIIAPHFRTNDVRHKYAELLEEEALAAAHTLVEFLDYAAASNDPEYNDLKALTRSWKDKPWTVIDSPKLRLLQAELELYQKRSQPLLAEYEHLKERESLADRLAGELREAKERAQRSEAKLREKDAQFDKKRSEVDGQRRRVKELEAQAAENASQLKRLADLRAYLDGVSRLTALTRTRRAFEEMILRLTPEQQRLVDTLPLDRETLIRGGAGSGKSLVLFKLLQRILNPPADSLDFKAPRSSVLLLTYGNTLTRYAQYWTSRLEIGVNEDTIQTVDALVFDLTKTILKRRTVYDWEKAEDLKEWIAPTGLSVSEFKTEAEMLVWGWDLTWDEYRKISRDGFKKPLMEAKRKVVWDALEKVQQSMEQAGVIAAPLAIRALESKQAEWENRKVDFVLLDEAQDLTPIRLRFFRALAKRGMVVAADEGQILYLNQSPFVRAGMDIGGGKTRVLKTNFRNTVPIETLAAQFYTGTLVPGAFREGPPAEWHFGDHTEELLTPLIAKIQILTEEFGYAPENILIIHAGKMSGLEDKLTAEDITYRSVMDKGFQFAEEGAIRLSTFQSAKGLDSPVVLVLWNKVFGHGEWSGDAVEKLQSTYLYVALSRALEQLHVFVRNDDSAVVKKLRELAR